LDIEQREKEDRMNRAVRLFSATGIALSLLVVAMIVLLPGLAGAQENAPSTSAVSSSAG